jgi:hypothetical protein
MFVEEYTSSNLIELLWKWSKNVPPHGSNSSTRLYDVMIQITTIQINPHHRENLKYHTEFWYFSFQIGQWKIKYCDLNWSKQTLFFVKNKIMIRYCRIWIDAASLNNLS